MSVHLSWITIFLGIPTVPRRGHHLQSDQASISFKIIIYSELVSLAFYCLAICLLGNTQLKRTWHHSLNKSQTNQIEAKKCDMPYSNAGIAGLAKRRVPLSREFFKFISQPVSCLYHLLQSCRDVELLYRLTALSKFSRILNRTKKYQSFTTVR